MAKEFKLTKSQKEILKEQGWDTDICKDKDTFWLEIDKDTEPDLFNYMMQVSNGAGSDAVGVLVIAMKDLE